MLRRSLGLLVNYDTSGRKAHSEVERDEVVLGPGREVFHKNSR